MKAKICEVLIKSEKDGKTYPVLLSDEQMQSILFILPQLFNGHKVLVGQPLDSVTLDRKLKLITTKEG